MLIVGGAALNLLGVIARSTRDIDILALGAPGPASPRLVPPSPLPDELLRGIATVARDFGLPANWMNAEVASQWRTGMPPGLDEGIEWRRFGGLRIGLPPRITFICLKLYAAADQPDTRNRHYQDLMALAPTPAELDEARQWIMTQDPTIDTIVAKVVASVLR